MRKVALTRHPTFLPEAYSRRRAWTRGEPERTRTPFRTLSVRPEPAVRDPDAIPSHYSRIVSTRFRYSDRKFAITSSHLPLPSLSWISPRTVSLTSSSPRPRTIYVLVRGGSDKLRTFPSPSIAVLTNANVKRLTGAGQYAIIYPHISDSQRNLCQSPSRADTENTTSVPVKWEAVLVATHGDSTGGDEGNDEYEAPGEYFEAEERSKEEYEEKRRGLAHSWRLGLTHEE